MTENRESFFARLEPFLAPSTLLDVQLAYTLAKFGHRAQTRKERDENGDPIRYFEHVRRVAIILIDEVRIVRSEMVISALLHDSLEDTRDVTPEVLEHCFGPEVAMLVKTLSKVPKEGYLDRFELSTDWRAYVLKACDRLDNLRSLAAGTMEFRTRQVAETREKYFKLFDRMLDLVPSEYQKRALGLRDQVFRETERQATLLEVQSRTGAT